MLHDEVFCIYCEKHHKCMIHRHAWVYIQTQLGLKKKYCKNATTGFRMCGDIVMFYDMITIYKSRV